MFDNTKPNVFCCTKSGITIYYRTEHEQDLIIIKFILDIVIEITQNIY